MTDRKLDAQMRSEAMPAAVVFVAVMALALCVVLVLMWAVFA